MLHSTARIWWLVMVVLLIAGCSEEGGHAKDKSGINPAGSMQLPLVSSGSSGNVYRLRDGVFEIIAMSTGETTFVSTEDNLDEEHIDVSLPEDVYLVYLQPGFSLEQVDSDMETDMDTETEDEPFTRAKKRDRIASKRSIVEVATDIVVDDTEIIEDTDDTEGTDDMDGGVPEPEVVLISDNPMMVEVYTDDITRAIFVFQLGGEIIGQNGTLSIGIDVIEGAGCTDDYEPNNDVDAASNISFDSRILATVCGGDVDFYTFEPGVPEGDMFQIDVLFSNNISDIDVELMDSNGEMVDFADSVTDNESVAAVSDGGSYTLVVYPYEPMENTYEIVLITELTPSSCCETSPLPGCADPEVEACVCDIDDWCCEVDFDNICLDISMMECQGAATCPLGEGDCCEASEEPGCDDEQIQFCVCSADPFCCFNAYDPYCVDLASSACGLECETVPPDSNCCEPGEAPGCTDSDINDCVCGVDPICCAHPFDENCVQLAMGVCGAQC